MEWKILHFYPDLMSLYGSYANAAVLKRYLERLGGDVSRALYPARRAGGPCRCGLHLYGRGHRAQPKGRSGGLCPGTARPCVPPRTAAPPCCLPARPWSCWVRPLWTMPGRNTRASAWGSSPPYRESSALWATYTGTTALCPEPVVGFMNKCARISGVETPLLSACAMGFGNEAEGGPEGFCRGNVLASELTGPILVKKPPAAQGRGQGPV